MDEKRTGSFWRGDDVGPDLAAARAKALSSPIRWQILRLCLHTGRTNKELAERLGVNPGSMLHHVRTLVGAGYLDPLQARRGARNSVEIPYIATQLTWDTTNHVPQMHSIMVDLLREETEEASSDDVRFWRLGVRLRATDVEELQERINALFEEYKARATAPDAADGGLPMSLMAFLHRDALQLAPRD